MNRLTFEIICFTPICVSSVFCLHTHTYTHTKTQKRQLINFIAYQLSNIRLGETSTLTQTHRTHACKKKKKKTKKEKDRINTSKTATLSNRSSLY